MGLLKDIDPSHISKLTNRAQSKDIVDEFIQSGKETMEVEVTKTGKTPGNIYQALFGYLKRHPDKKVGVRLMDCDRVILYRTT